MRLSPVLATLLLLPLGGCAKFPKNGVGDQYTRMTFDVTLAGPVDPNYIYVVAIRPLYTQDLYDDRNGPVGVYNITTGNPQNGIVEGLPTRYVVYDPTQPTAYSIVAFTNSGTDQSPNLNLTSYYTIGAVVSGVDPQASGSPSNHLHFDLYTSDLVMDKSNAQKITNIQFNIITCNVRLTQGNVSTRITDALGNINDLGLSGLGYQQRYIITSTGYSNTGGPNPSSNPEGSNDEYSPSGKYDPALDITDWSLDVATP